jgi:hypothetical protein
MKHSGIAILIVLLLLASCEQVDREYPDEPVINYQSFAFSIGTDQLGNITLIGHLSFEFTDGDGNIGLSPLAENSEPTLPDSVKYNFFLQLYDLQENEFVQIPEEDGGVLKYRIPVLNKQPTSGVMDLEISYPIIVHDTIFYTFYIQDRDFNHSNTDSTDVQVLSHIDLSDYQ